MEQAHQVKRRVCFAGRPRQPVGGGLGRECARTERPVRPRERARAAQCGTRWACRWSRSTTSKCGTCWTAPAAGHDHILEWLFVSLRLLLWSWAARLVKVCLTQRQQRHVQLDQRSACLCLSKVTGLLVRSVARCDRRSMRKRPGCSSRTRATILACNVTSAVYTHKKAHPLQENSSPIVQNYSFLSEAHIVTGLRPATTASSFILDLGLGPPHAGDPQQQPGGRPERAGRHQGAGLLHRQTSCASWTSACATAPSRAPPSTSAAAGRTGGLSFRYGSPKSISKTNMKMRSVQQIQMLRMESVHYFSP